MTAQNYIDEVKLRILRLGVVKSLGDQYILSMINKARKEVQKATISIMSESYGKIITLTTIVNDPDSAVADTFSGSDIGVLYYELPDDFIDAQVVLLKWSDNQAEARRITKTEMYNVQMHSWNAPTSYRPIYAIERYEENGVWGWRLYIADIQNINNYEVDLWYIAAIDDLENVNAADSDEDEVVIQPDTEELIVLYALQYCLQHNDIALQSQSVNMEIQIQEAMIRQNYVLTEEVKLDIPSKEGI